MFWLNDTIGLELSLNTHSGNLKPLAKAAQDQSQKSFARVDALGAEPSPDIMFPTLTDMVMRCQEYCHIYVTI